MLAVEKKEQALDAGINITNIEDHIELSVLKKTQGNKMRGQLVGKLGSALYYVDASASVKELVDDFNKLFELQVVGVVKEGDDTHEVVGVIIRKELFNMLGKPFGRDILENKTILELMENEHLNELITIVPYFYIERNIFSAINELKEYLQSRDLKYFVLAKGKKEFAGIFTNIDVLFYLSSITQQDLEAAHSLQSNIVKEKCYIEEERFNFIAGSRMAKGVGGDFYVIQKFSDTKWVISLCDVSGKGVSAALVTSLLGGLFNIYNFNSGLTEFIKKMNEYVLKSFNMEKYLTGVFMKFDEETGKVKLFDMGHSYIYVYRDRGLYKFKTSDDNVPIGFIPEIAPKGNQFTLKKGDILFAVTDGITEQTDSEGNEYGMSKILSIIEKNKDNNFENIIIEMQKDIDNFRGFHPQHDDMTMVVLQYNG